MYKLKILFRQCIGGKSLTKPGFALAHAISLAAVATEPVKKWVQNGTLTQAGATASKKTLAIY